MKPQIPANKQNNKQDTLKTQQSNVNLIAKTKPLPPSINKGQNNTPKPNKIAPFLNKNKIAPFLNKNNPIAAKPT